MGYAFMASVGMSIISFEFFRFARAEKEVGGLLVRLKGVEPGATFHIISTHVKGEGVAAVVVSHVKVLCDAHLAEAVHARRGFAFFLRFGEGRQEQGGENGNDRDDDKQFDEGKTSHSAES